MNFNSNLSIDDLPKSLLSMVTPILFCRDAFGLVVEVMRDADGSGSGIGKGMMNGRGGNSGKICVLLWDGSAVNLVGKMFVSGGILCTSVIFVSSIDESAFFLDLKAA